ncbi:hypothetical protein F4777DRAFT_576800 [Nemania sp. FL0916]|nr:hypothetical protein F4777DRAFT_576800 [Nemania sp. FL0916]
MSDEERPKDEELVAIVGMGCRWPGGVDSPAGMWAFLRYGGSGYRSFDSSSASRSFSATGFYHPKSGRPGTMATQGGFLLDRDPRLFDHSFFGITQREAETLDPSQRKLLEVVYEAFENAGETWASVAASNTGVFVGNFALDHWLIQARDWDYPKPYSTTGVSASVLANRISHVFDLRGPSVTIDTACASSMYAVHLAVSAIRNGDCDSAIVAASNWIADPSLQIALDKLGALSPTSTCHTFDAAADGYARGEGFAALYLKRVSAARMNESPIRAVIRGTAVNANGRTSGITRPNASAQEAVIRKAYDNAGLSFSDTTYFECHGTGTPAGDPVELEAIGKVFASDRRPGTDLPGLLFVGSVKTNMGHGEGASGLAAIMKVVLSLEAGEIPPNIGIKTLNPSIDFSKSGVEVIRQLTAWPRDRLRRASINSFGFGGANGHCIIDHVGVLALDRVRTGPRTNGHAPDCARNGDGGQNRKIHINHSINDVPIMKRRIGAASRQLVLLPFSAHNKTSLQLNIDALSRCIHQHRLADVAYTLSAKRSMLLYRDYRIVDRSNPHLGLLSMDSKSVIRTNSTDQHHQPPKVAFVFTGQGAQWHGMGAQLLEYRVFRNVIEHLDGVLQSLTTPPEWSIFDVLNGNCMPDLVQTPQCSQTVCTAIQLGLVDLLASWSVRPAAVVGHSSGEIAAAYASGCCTIVEAIVIAYLRGLAVSQNKLKGAMLAVGLGLEQLRDSRYLVGDELEPIRVQIAAINSPNSVTVSGDISAVETLAARLDVDRVFHRLLKTGGVAYHSHHMKAPGQEYEKMLVRDFEFITQSGLVDERDRYPLIPWVSSVVPDKDPSLGLTSSAAYWRANLESPVCFSQAVSKLVQLNRSDGDGSGLVDVLIELGPHSALKGPLEQILKAMDQTRIVYAGSTLSRGQDGQRSILQLAGALYCLNAEIHLDAVNAVDNDEAGSDEGESRKIASLVHGRVAVDLPPYQYTYGPILYHETRSSKEYRLRNTPRHDLLGSKVPGVAKFKPQWRNVLSVKDLHWLDDHRLMGDVIFPAAGYIVMAIEAALRTHEESCTSCLKPTGYSLRNVSIEKAMILPKEGHGVEIMLSMNCVNSTPMVSSAWASFSITSVGPAPVDSIDSMWTEHCTGEIKIEVETSHNKVERIETASMGSRGIDTRSLYKAFGAVGLRYGPAFQALSKVRADPDQNIASAVIDLMTTQGTTEGGESRYVLHPAALDAAFQLGLVACYGGQIEDTAVAFVPVHLSRLYIKGDITSSGQDAAMAVAQGEFRGLRGAHVNQLQMLDPNGEVVLHFEKLRCLSYITESQSNDQAMRNTQSAFSAPFARLVWKPDFRSLNQHSCRALFPPPRENLDRLVLVEKITGLACAILFSIYQKFAKRMTDTRTIASPSKSIAPFWAWVKQCVEEAAISEMAEVKQLSSQKREEIISQYYREIGDVVEVQIAKILYENMEDILFERQTSVDILISGDDNINLLSALYQNGLFMTSAYPQLSRVLDGLAHANPHQRILEVGAGTAGATRIAMKALVGPNGIKRYCDYGFTDISPGFLAAARASMADFRDISYSVLDIEADPASQGYQPVYDIVLASQSLHATSSISRALSNCRKLLRPGGKLILVENTKEDSVIAGLLLGTLTGYWHGIPDRRVNSPFLNLEKWDKVLREVGFSGADLVLDDYPRPYSMLTTVVSSVVEICSGDQKTKKTNGVLKGDEVQLIHSRECNTPLLSRLREELDRRGISHHTAPLGQQPDRISSDARVVVILDGEKDFLLDTEGRDLSIFQHLARNAAILLCLTFCGFSRGRNPEGALIPGLLRTVGTENPAGRFISIDVSVETTNPVIENSQDLVHYIVDQLSRSADDSKAPSPRMRDDEYVWQDGCLWISRAVPDSTLQPYTNSNSQGRSADMSLYPIDSQGPVCAAFSTPGILSSLYFRPYRELLAPIPSDYIDVKVAAVGINWKDLAVSSGRFDAINLSSEYAGTVTAVGSGAVGRFYVGDRVYGVGRGNFGNYTRVPAAFAQKLTAADDLIQVATMPLVMMTAVYAFDYVVHLRRGHKVLVQSATGGLGLAAIQLARAKGAEVFAMVGTAEKADFLIREIRLPKSHVITVSKRDSVCGLEKKLAGMTADGRGFDVILATTRGDILRASVEALAPLGHLVDVGRTDVQDSKTLGMEVFGKSASFSSFDLSIIFDINPSLIGELMQTVHNYYRDGLIGPVCPFSATDVSRLDQVLLQFSKGTHIGKLVVTFQDPKTLVKMISAPSQPRARFDPEGLYIVVGLGGLGKSIIRWMCGLGARKLVILSRRGIEGNFPAAHALISNLTERGIDIKFLTCDISDRTRVVRVIKDISTTYQRAPIRGIIHAAVSYLDVSFDKLTVSRWRDSISAKVQGTKNLHDASLSLPRPLDFFVMITSLESIWALATQSAYTAANAFQDAFARYRRRLGMPATSISLGLVKGIGELGQDSSTIDMFARNGALTLSEAEFLARLEVAIVDDKDVGTSRTCGNGEDWIGQAEDPLSASNILTCLDPYAMMDKEREEEAETHDTGLPPPLKSFIPRWYSDGRVSLIMRAFEDAQRDWRMGGYSNTAAKITGKQTDQDHTGKSSTARVRQQFGAVIAAGAPERNKAAEFITNAIRTVVAEMFFVDVSNVNPARAVADHGVDSLIAAELRNWFYQALGVKITMSELLDVRTSISALASGIVDTVLNRPLTVNGER